VLLLVRVNDASTSRAVRLDAPFPKKRMRAWLGGKLLCVFASVASPSSSLRTDSGGSLFFQHLQQDEPLLIDAMNRGWVAGTGLPTATAQKKTRCVEWSETACLPALC
jgi:hypothetical protein